MGVGEFWLEDEWAKIIRDWEGDIKENPCNPEPGHDFHLNMMHNGCNVSIRQAFFIVGSVVAMGLSLVVCLLYTANPMQLIEGVGLASVACYLSLYLNVPLPRDIIFLGEVHYHGGVHHPTLLDEHYLDFCVREGFSRIVGPVKRLQALNDLVTLEQYQGIKLIGLNNALDIVYDLFMELVPGDEDEAVAAV